MLQAVEDVRAARLLGKFVRLVVRNGDLARPRFDLALAMARQVVASSSQTNADAHRDQSTEGKRGMDIVLT